MKLKILVVSLPIMLFCASVLAPRQKLSPDDEAVAFKTVGRGGLKHERDCLKCSECVAACPTGAIHH